jgi:hypothetical protein
VGGGAPRTARIGERPVSGGQSKRVNARCFWPNGAVWRSGIRWPGWKVRVGSNSAVRPRMSRDFAHQAGIVDPDLPAGSDCIRPIPWAKHRGTTVRQIGGVSRSAAQADAPVTCLSLGRRDCAQVRLRVQQPTPERRGASWTVGAQQGRYALGPGIVAALRRELVTT